MPELPNLRTLSIEWPLRLLCSAVGEHPRPAVGGDLLGGLLSLPFARHLTHLASGWPFDDAQSEAIRGVGVEPRHASHGSWVHDVPPARFRPRGRAPGE